MRKQMRSVKRHFKYPVCALIALLLTNACWAMRADPCPPKEPDKCFPANDPIVARMDRLADDDVAGVEAIFKDVYSDAQRALASFMNFYSLRLKQDPTLKDDVQRDCDRYAFMHDWLRCAGDSPETDSALDSYIANYNRARYVAGTAAKYGIDLSQKFAAFDQLELGAYDQMLNAAAGHEAAPYGKESSSQKPGPNLESERTLKGSLNLKALKRFFDDVDKPLPAEMETSETRLLGLPDGNPNASSKTGDPGGRNQVEDDGEEHHRGVLLDFFPEAERCRASGWSQTAESQEGDAGCPGCAGEEGLPLHSMSPLLLEKVKAARTLLESESKAYVDLLGRQIGIDAASFEEGLSELDNSCKVRRSDPGQRSLLKRIFGTDDETSLAQSYLSRALFEVIQGARAQFHIVPDDEGDPALVEKQRVAFTEHQTSGAVKAIASSKKLVDIDKAYATLMSDFPPEPAKDSHGLRDFLSCQAFFQVLDKVLEGVRERGSGAKCPPRSEVLSKKLNYADEMQRREAGQRNGQETEADALIRNGMSMRDGEPLLEANPDVISKGSKDLVCYEKALKSLQLEFRKAQAVGSSIELLQAVLASGETPEENAVWRCQHFKATTPTSVKARTPDQQAACVGVDEDLAERPPETPEPLYVRLGQDSPHSSADVWGRNALVLKKQLAPSATVPRLKNLRDTIASICANPFDVGNKFYKSDFLYNAYLTCGEEPGENVPPAWREYESKRWKRCMARKQNAEGLCKIRKEILADPSNEVEEGAEKGKRALLAAADGMSCTIFASIGRAIYETGLLLSEGASGAAAAFNLLAKMPAQAVISAVEHQLNPLNLLITGAMFGYGLHEAHVATDAAADAQSKMEAGLADYRDWQASKKAADNAVAAVGHGFIVGLLIPEAIETTSRGFSKAKDYILLVGQEAKRWHQEVLRLETEAAHAPHSKEAAKALESARSEFDQAMRQSLGSALRLDPEALKLLTHNELMGIAHDEKAAIAKSKVEKARQQILSALYDPEFLASLGDQAEAFMASIEHAIDSKNPEAAVRALAEAYAQVDTMMAFAPEAKLQQKKALNAFLEKSLKGLGFDAKSLPSAENWPERVRLFAEGLLNQLMHQNFSTSGFAKVTAAAEAFRKQFQSIYDEIIALEEINVSPKIVEERFRAELAKLAEQKRAVADELNKSSVKPSDEARRLLLTGLDEMEGLVKSVIDKKLPELAEEYGAAIEAAREASAKALGTEISKRLNRGGRAQRAKFEKILNQHRAKAAARWKALKKEAKGGAPYRTKAESWDIYVHEWEQDFYKRMKKGPKSKDYPSLEEALALMAAKSEFTYDAFIAYFEIYGTVKLRSRILLALRHPFNAFVRRPVRWAIGKISKKPLAPLPARVVSKRGLLTLGERKILIDSIEVNNPQQLWDLAGKLTDAVTEAVYGPSFAQALGAAFKSEPLSAEVRAFGTAVLQKMWKSFWQDIRGSVLAKEAVLDDLHWAVLHEPRPNVQRALLERGLMGAIREFWLSLEPESRRLSDPEIQRQIDLWANDIGIFLRPALRAVYEYKYGLTAGVALAIYKEIREQPQEKNEGSQGDIAALMPRPQENKEATNENVALFKGRLDEIDRKLEVVEKALKNPKLRPGQKKKLEEARDELVNEKKDYEGLLENVQAQAPSNAKDNPQ